MVYIQPFLRLVYIGTLYGAEDFSFSMALIQGPNGPSEPPTTIPTNVLEAGRLIMNASGHVSSSASLTLVKLNQIGRDGRYTEPVTVEREVLPVANGTAGSTPAPQVALAISLRTDVSRGYAHAGRFYMPLPGTTLQPDGRVSVAAAVSFADSAVQAINMINASFNGEWRVGVVSNVGQGTERFVTKVACGRVYDTIRSRRSSLDEDHQLSSVAIAP